METIRNYLDNMFAAFPKTGEVSRLRNELLGTMEDKYNELKAQGKTENEAIGIVISEFGNIEELMQEMGVVPGKTAEEPGDPELPRVDRACAEDFLHLKRMDSWRVAAGVALCILSPAVFILLAGRTSLRGQLPVAAMLLLVAVAVGLFVFTGLQGERYSFLSRDFYLEPDAKAMAQQGRELFLRGKNLYTLVGILLIILGVIFVFLLTDGMGRLVTVVPLFVFVAAGVFCLVRTSIVDEAYKMLLQLESFSKKQKEADKVIGAVAAVWWPVSVVVYLVWSFTTRNWGTTWILWPVSGVLFGAFSGAWSILKGDE